MDYYAHPLLEKVMKDQDNILCNDCRAGHPNWASINNGVLLCLNCAGIHRGFGVQVSIIRSLTMDNWDETQVSFLLKGGNRRFNEIMREYNVPDNAGPEFKYLISTANYYRKVVKEKAEIMNESLPDRPDSINGLELLDYGNNNYTNITNSEPITNESVIKNEFKQTNKKNGFFGKIGGFFGSVKESLSEKIKDSKIGEKIKETGEKAIVVAKKTGIFVVEKGKEAYNTNFVQNLAHKTEEGINKIVIKAKKVFINDEVPPEQNIYSNYVSEPITYKSQSNSTNPNSISLNDTKNNQSEVKYPSFEAKQQENGYQ